MIDKITQELKNSVPAFFQSDHSDLTFLKFSTSISGTGKGNKVLFFIFENKNKIPIVVIKTVRSKSDAMVIQNGNKNLNYLNSLIEGTPYSSMFPKALMFYSDKDVLFNAETVCTGRKAKSSDIEKIIKQYFSFSKHICKSLSDNFKIDFAYGEKLIRQLEGKEETINELISYLKELWKDEGYVLPKVPQHGDVTIDNVLINKKFVMFIDCDIFGSIVLPGYDVFHFLTRSKVANWQTYLIDYFQTLNIEYVPDKKLFFMYFLHELTIKKDYILNNRNSRDVIEEFEAMT